MLGCSSGKRCTKAAQWLHSTAIPCSQVDAPGKGTGLLRLLDGKVCTSHYCAPGAFLSSCLETGCFKPLTPMYTARFQDFPSLLAKRKAGSLADHPFSHITAFFKFFTNSCVVFFFLQAFSGLHSNLFNLTK